MSRFLKVTAIFISALLGLCILLWLGLLTYVHFNKDKFTRTVTATINERISGEVTFSDIDLTVLKGFPDVSFEIKDLVIKDSLWHVHKTEIVNIQRAYTQISLSSVFDGEAYIDKLTLEEGRIHLFTNEDSISNTGVLRTDTTKIKKTKSKDNPLVNLQLNNIDILIQHIPKKKDFLLAVDNCLLQIKHNGTGWTAVMDGETELTRFSFNTDKGSFMEEMLLDVALKMEFDKAKAILTVPPQTVLLDKAPYTFGGEFNFNDTPFLFNIDIRGVDVDYAGIHDILTPAISSKLKDIQLQKVDTVDVKLIGKMKYRDTPYVKASFVVKNKDVVIPKGTLSNSSFTGFFMDEVVQGYGHGDPNSMVQVNNFTGHFYGIPLNIKQASVKDLRDPVVHFDMTSDFNVSKLNPLLGSSSFIFSDGNAHVNLNCALAIKETSNIPPSLRGTISFTKVGCTYTPRSLKFKNVSGKLVFKEADVFLEQFKAQNGQNIVQANGEVKNLLNLYYTAPEKVVIEANVTSDKISLDEYISFLGQRGGAKKDSKATAAQLKDFAGQLDKVMENSVAKINLDIKTITYKKFNADKVTSQVTVAKSDIELKDTKLRHAGGTLNINAGIKPGNNNNVVKINADIDHVDVQKLFTSFGNFGQTAIIDSNIRGKLSANVNVTGGISYSGTVLPQSLNGDVKFNLQEGHLIDFEPLGTVGKIIFFNRNLSDIKIEPLTNTFNINNGSIYINPMYIQTSAFNIFTEGTYGVPTGTDILIQVPLRNPKKDLDKKGQRLTEKDMKKGIVINLHATDDNTGDVKIKLGKGNH